MSQVSTNYRHGFRHNKTLNNNQIVSSDALSYDKCEVIATI